MRSSRSRAPGLSAPGQRSLAPRAGRDAADGQARRGASHREYIANIGASSCWRGPTASWPSPSRRPPPRSRCSGTGCCCAPWCGEPSDRPAGLDPPRAAGVPLMLLTVFNQIYGTLDIPILASIAGATIVGWYVLAYRWAGIPIFIANVVIGSHYPEMSIHGETPETCVRRRWSTGRRSSSCSRQCRRPSGLGVVAVNLIAPSTTDEFPRRDRPAPDPRRARYQSRGWTRSS